ncbi:MAG: DUF2851 family protein [Verrucomicrobiota bacterium]
MMKNGSKYEAFLSSLQEEKSKPTDEALIQRMWFEEVFASPLKTVEGEEIVIKQPGFWNYGAGPDFLRAVICNGKGEIEVGDIEIHLSAKRWLEHGHESDQAYEKVILHAVWETGPKEFFTGSLKRKFIRLVELKSQLREGLCLSEIEDAFTSDSEERNVGIKYGKCKRELSLLTDEQIKNLLLEAGWYRFEKKVRLWSLRKRIFGYSQALWVGLADALGYAGSKENRSAFVGLVRKSSSCGISQLLKEKSAVKREALLFGLAGFLPTKSIKLGDSSGNHWLRELWEEWWKMRVGLESETLAKSRWNLRGIRPANRPERRLAVLALLSDKKQWRSFEKRCKAASSKEIESFLGDLDHPFWSWHYTMQSKRTSKQISLLASGRVRPYLYNVVWPLVYRSNKNLVSKELEEAKSTLTNHPSQVAAVRLLGDRAKKIRGLKSSLLVQEGLLQIYRDFCLTDTDRCESCQFSTWVKSL